MAKNRMIRTETWTDEKFVSLDPLARLLFIGMWNYACDNGHLDDSALQLKMRVLPADSCDVPALLEQIIDSGMVSRENGYLKVVNLSEKQPLDLRFLVFCDHCDMDPERRYERSDKKGGTRAARGTHASDTSAAPEPPSGTRRSGDVDGGGDGDVDTTAPRKRGTRIDPDFVTTDAMRAWAKKEGLDYLDLDDITEEFVDYWVGVPGSKGTKLDWVATWRNRVREVAKRTSGSRATLKAAPKPLPSIAEIRRMEAEREARERGESA